MKKEIIYCKVMYIRPTFAIVEYNSEPGICHISEISDYLVTDIKQYLTVGETYPFQLLDEDKQRHRFQVSFKRIRPKLLKRHRCIIETTSGFTKLYENTMKLLDKLHS